METQLEAQNIVLQEFGTVSGEEIADADSFTKTSEIIESNETEKRAISFGLFELNEEEKNSLKVLSETFSLHKTMQKLVFSSLEGEA